MQSNLPLILVTNDDGVHAPGITALAEAVADLGEVHVVAPDRDQSAVSHMLSLHRPLRAAELRERVWSVQGTPADCVYLATFELLPRKPALLLSGINSGPNLGSDVHYSGTVSAAIEGTLLGLPSIAVSLADRERSEIGIAARFTRALAESLLTRGGLPHGTTLNVNVPAGEPDRHRITFLGPRPYEQSIHRRVDPRGRTYYWIGGEPLVAATLPGSDSTTVAEGIISVTPLMLDLTDYRLLMRTALSVEIRGYAGAAPELPPKGYWPGEPA